ncbi:MAG: hypothetical protein ACKVY0_16785 [Prosthecobacter sp.]|uniref:hypothetical protein n=1 Tax=Prosthecobacter sp. TaxID=1965333 RepID=UPI00390016F0
MNPSLGHPRLQSLILRAACLMSLLTLGAVFAPEYVLGKLNWFLGLGKLPDSVLLRYLGSGGSFVYIITGLLMWMMAGDVVRYRPMIVFSAWLMLAAAPIYAYINIHTGMPRWCAVMDVVTCLGFGAALLWACHARPKSA